MSKKRILVIDDSETIHQDFRRILCPEKPGEMDALEELEGFLFGTPSAGGGDSSSFELDSAFQGQEGFAKVRQALEAGDPYALAFLDYRMPPGWNGFETLKKLRTVAPSLPVVLCSAYSDYSWEEIIRQLGGDPQLKELRKPFDMEELHKLARTLTQPQAAHP